MCATETGSYQELIARCFYCIFLWLFLIWSFFHRSLLFSSQAGWRSRPRTQTVPLPKVWHHCHGSSPWRKVWARLRPERFNWDGCQKSSRAASWFAQTGHRLSWDGGSKNEGAGGSKYGEMFCHRGRSWTHLEDEGWLRHATALEMGGCLSQLAEEVSSRSISPQRKV